MSSSTIIRQRQTIESLFNQINEKVKLQNALKLKSLNRSIIHVFWKILNYTNGEWLTKILFFKR